MFVCRGALSAYEAWPEGEDTPRPHIVVIRNVLHELDIQETSDLLYHISHHCLENDELLIQDLMVFTDPERGNVCWRAQNLDSALKSLGWQNSFTVESTKSRTMWFSLMATRHSPYQGEKKSVEQNIFEQRVSQWHEWKKSGCLTPESNGKYHTEKAKADFDLQFGALTKQIADMDPNAFGSPPDEAEDRLSEEKHETHKNSGDNLTEDSCKHFSEREKMNRDNDFDRRITALLKDRLSDALSMFSDQPKVWVDPILYEPENIGGKSGNEERTEVKIDDLIREPYSVVIKAPPQFGLTCLAHHLTIEAWKVGSLWLYLDMDKINIHIFEPEKSVVKGLQKMGLGDKKVDCIILDSWKPSAAGAMKVLRGLCNTYDDVPVIVMYAIGDFGFNSEEKVNIDRRFRELRLAALPRNSIRKVVSDYNTKKNIGDEDVVLGKVVKDIDALNMHRTPMNCITLLKISEKHFDESPVNRTKMIEMILFVLFDLFDIPTYKTKPDVKDCEYVLGYFCELMIKEGRYDFTKEEFIGKTSSFCNERLLDLEVWIVFDILFENRIIINHGGGFRFKALYWICYFAANRMHADEVFYQYIVNERTYVNLPELVEFYTGIDRRGSDMVRVLTADLSEQCAIVEKKTGLSIDFNLFESMEWDPSKKDIEEIQRRINDEVSKSNLPDSLKDKYADKDYDFNKPYDQEVREVLDKYTFLILDRKIRASSRALRNSDYIKPEEKRLLLKEIARGWSLFSKILFVLSPIMAARGWASFDGLGFILSSPDGLDIMEKIDRIILTTPGFVTALFKDDLFSPKGAPVLYETIDSTESKLIKHELMLLLIFCRPKGWDKHVENYIRTIPKKSAYLLDISNLLRNRCKYDFASKGELAHMGNLLKMCYARHISEGHHLIDDMKRISNSVIPERVNNEE
uniref:Uncharacterized protein n=1 Tax=Candidatus Kentrum sp. FW TaxID=2126338 RepID=A0A450U244_9GAMM|nr:MAG: hypothetical protein BECKFW1821C_GA0114237_111111 [Candidatus Kentron sp. FW]